MSIEVTLQRLHITPKSHPSHYLLHKYWGRKSHNLIEEYIQLFTKPGDVVLDPFMGSGGVVIESNKLGRTGIGVDLNPMACLIVSETLKPAVNYDKLRQVFDDIIASIPQDVIDLTYTTGTDGERHIIDNAIWQHGQLTRIKYYLGRTRMIKEADAADCKRAQKAEQLLRHYESTGAITYPSDKIMAYVKRSGKNHINELFSHRNLLIAAFFMAGIKRIDDSSMKDSLLLIFTSALPNFSSMIPGNIATVNGLSGWQISKFWVPKIHAEKNALNTLRLRLEKYIKGKKEIAALATPTNYKIYNQSSENLQNIAPKSVDYVFTDPPYGDSIAYLALSSFWTAWIGYAVDYAGEIIYDPYRNKREEDYSQRLDNAFKQVHQVLKDGGYMSFTFHNRHVKFWKIVIDAVGRAGFVLVNVKWVDQAVASGTQGINRNNTLRGDFVYTFKKNGVVEHEDKIINGEHVIDQTMKRLLRDAPYVTTARLYESLIPALVKQQAYYDANGKLLDIDKYIARQYTYKQQTDGHYGWSI